METIICPCGKKIKVFPSRIKKNKGKYCSKECCYKYRKRPSGLKYEIHKENPTWFKKGCETWNKGIKCPEEVKNKIRETLKGQRNSIRTEFKKGMKIWNKGKDWKEMQWENHPNFKNGYTRYIAFIKRQGIKPICTECGKKGKFGRKMQIHHIDGNRNNNLLNNLQVLCSKCHANKHKNWRKRKWLGKNSVVV